MNAIFEKWAMDWGINNFALTDLRNRLAIVTPGGAKTPEAVVQQGIRLEAGHKGIRLWRNNNGACEDKAGRLIRYGLGNDSSKVNANIKSSDLIGITPLTVVPEHVGKTLGIFTSIEVKKGGWKYTGTKREVAQAAWLQLVTIFGGIAKFANKREDL